MTTESNVRKTIETLFNAPTKLEKLDEVKQQYIAKQAATESQLRTLVQSQLESVKSGLDHLNHSVEEFDVLQHNLAIIKESFDKFNALKSNLEQLFGVSEQRDLYYNVLDFIRYVENIGNIAATIQQLIENEELLSAHWELAELERSRDEIIWKLEEQQNTSCIKVIQEHFKKVDDCWEQLRKHMKVTFQNIWSCSVQRPELIVSCVRIVYREEKSDEAKRWRRTTMGGAETETKQLLKFMDSCFSEAVQTRVEGASRVWDRDANKNWVVQHLEFTKKLLVKDLSMISVLFPQMFPPEYKVVRRFLEFYHTAVGVFLADLIDTAGINSRQEMYQFLTWVNKDYLGPECLGRPNLRLTDDAAQLKPLLDEQSYQKLHRRCLEQNLEHMRELVGNALNGAKKQWRSDTAPDKQPYDNEPVSTYADSHYFTPLPNDIYQIVHEHMEVAQRISEHFSAALLEECWKETVKFMDSLSEAVQEFAKEYTSARMRDGGASRAGGLLGALRPANPFDESAPAANPFADAPSAACYFQYLLALINDCDQYLHYVDVMADRYAPDQRELYQKYRLMIEKNIETLLRNWFHLVVETIFKDLEVYTSKILTPDWINNPQAIDTILFTIDDYQRDLMFLKPTYYNKVTQELLAHTCAIYIAALTKRRSKRASYRKKRKSAAFRSEADRVSSAKQIRTEVDKLLKMFQQLNPNIKEDDTRPIEALSSLLAIPNDSTGEHITIIAELTPVIKVCAGLHEEQLVNLLTSRGDVSSGSEVVKMAIDSLNTYGQSMPYSVFHRAMMLAV